MQSKKLTDKELETLKDELEAAVSFGQQQKGWLHNSGMSTRCCCGWKCNTIIA